MGFDVSNTDQLKKMILAQLPNNPAIFERLDKHGQRYSVDTELTGSDGTAIVRTDWIVDGEDGVPRLIFTYVKES